LPPTRESLHRLVRIEHHHVFRHLRAHLEAEAGATGADGRGGAPASAATGAATVLATYPAGLRPGDDETEPALATEKETRFQHGQDGEALRIAHHRLGNRLLGDLPESLEDGDGLIDVVLKLGQRAPLRRPAPAPRAPSRPVDLDPSDRWD
jgi:hypothetical protein